MAQDASSETAAPARVALEALGYRTGVLVGQSMPTHAVFAGIDARARDRPSSEWLDPNLLYEASNLLYELTRLARTHARELQDTSLVDHSEVPIGLLRVWSRIGRACRHDVAELRRDETRTSMNDAVVCLIDLAEHLGATTDHALVEDTLSELLRAAGDVSVRAAIEATQGKNDRVRELVQGAFVGAGLPTDTRA